MISRCEPAVRLERVVIWRLGKPVHDEVDKLLKKYITHAGWVGWWSESFKFVVKIIGEPCHPFDLFPSSGEDPYTRHFDVTMGADRITVVTYNGDPLICSVADGFVKLATKKWATAPAGVSK